MEIEMTKWTVEALSADRTIVTLTRPMTLTLRVGDHVQIKPNKKWQGGNRAQVLALLDDGFSGKVSHENRRTRFFSAATELGDFSVPYSAVEDQIY